VWNDGRFIRFLLTELLLTQLEGFVCKRLSGIRFPPAYDEFMPTAAP
jgi:hypothetical protein